MFCLASLALVTTAASVSGLVVPRVAPPPGWATEYLESYDTYHTRYLAIGCSSKHNTPFFDQCCHPLLANQNAATSLPALCTSVLSASPTSSAVIPAPSDDDDEECDDEGDDDGDGDIVVTSTPAVMTTSNPTGAPSPTIKITSVTSSKTSHTPSKTSSEARVQPTSASQTHLGGFATYFYQNGVAGACGTVHRDSDFIAAIDAARYGNTGLRSPLCGKQVKITNLSNKKSVVVTIADACPTCNNENSIDLSEAAFKQIASLEQGIVDIEWQFK
ncbi:hypothetical protein C0993_009965 [Termitomyces sp. T159_Od127]|nr:hypothetical protein C0993_009965 [Termitomyces sp. T159_Od127]